MNIQDDIDQSARTSARVRSSMPRWSEDDLVAHLQAAAVDGYLSTDMYQLYVDAKGGSAPSLSAYTSVRWSCWNDAIRAAALKNGQAKRSYEKMTDDRLAGDVAKAIIDLGKAPSVREYKAYRRRVGGLASDAIIRRRFATWPDALRSAYEIAKTTTRGDS